jgi:hypothetical protein
MAKKVREQKELRGSLTQEQINVIRRDACQEFRNMSVEEQRLVSVEAVAAASVDPFAIDGPVAAPFDNSALWGMSASDTPLDERVAEELIKDIMQVEKVTAQVL